MELKSFIQNKEIVNYVPKMLYLGTFRAALEKTLVIFEISIFGFLKMQSFLLKKKLNLGPKLSCLGIFGFKFGSTIVIFEISALEFVKIQSFK